MFEPSSIERFSISGKQLLIRELRTSIRRIVARQDQQPPGGRCDVIGIRYPSNKQYVCTASIFTDVHSSEELRIDPEYDVRCERVPSANAGSKPILSILQKSICTKLDSVSRQPPHSGTKILS